MPPDPSYPVRQVVHAVHCGAFCVVLNVPALQVVHARSLVEVPAVETYVPATQLLHVAQVSWFAVAVYVPEAQLAQTRSEMLEPLVTT